MSEYKKVHSVIAEVDKIKARDYNQIIQNIESIKGGETFEKPVSTISELDTRLKIVEKNGGGTGNGESGEAETTGKDIYGEEGVEVVTNKVWKNKAVYRKSFYDKKDMFFYIDGLKQENIFSYTLKGRYFSEADNIIFNFGDSLYSNDGSNYVMVKLFIAYENNQVCVLLLAEYSNENPFDGIIIEYDAHIEYIKDEE